ncbi:hypothetical protein ACH4C2_10740 [Streptomyces sp. NPDC018057]|uniref:hypothetical protein n=1 Tax=unclassified Streptomyces TaxID=2593676 RepID=UPI0037BD94D1
MAYGVVDEVGDEAFDQPRAPGRGGGREASGEVDAAVPRPDLPGGEYSFDDLGEVERVPAGDAALAGGRREQRPDEPLLVLAEGECLLAGRAQGPGVVLVGLLSLGAATAVRDSATGIGLVLGLLYVFPVVAGTVADPRLRRVLERTAPTGAGLAATAGWAAAALLAGGLLLRGRDT